MDKVILDFLNSHTIDEIIAIKNLMPVTTVDDYLAFLVGMNDDFAVELHSDAQYFIVREKHGKVTLDEVKDYLRDMIKEDYELLRTYFGKKSRKALLDEFDWKKYQLD